MNTFEKAPPLRPCSGRYAHAHIFALVPVVPNHLPHVCHCGYQLIWPGSGMDQHGLPASSSVITAFRSGLGIHQQVHARGGRDHFLPAVCLLRSGEYRTRSTT